MDSQATLVNPTEGVPVGVRTVLAFDHTITPLSSSTARVVPSRAAAYAIDTHKSFASSKTIIKNLQTDKVVATITRSDVVSDTITLVSSGDGATEEKHKLEKWLKAPKFRDFPLTFEIAGREYHWTVGAGKTLKLSAASDADTTLAWHEPATGSGGRLLLTPAADEIRDLVLVSCVAALQRWAASIRAAQFGTAVARDDRFGPL
ncbi:hypothetical protein CONPUDRAFT_165726 [Coniophora puteana RWD-64-598 SS2]|uniref:DUF6593 domain-containing protein n=1 Tax=Coniophora puteana (strain RWD-64-598) TaxID=741705 RepID=A0A5M3MSZ1_CONPW|nr:uncharacterized protein CONPUDRAFT_165726 [Coniophora puteana RWD-64-598 SS2]EIW81641.1 hypothetical protein CONPUDRAFT_165726 [Coniophora puteana RWD-64-598 SS2]